MAYCQDNTAIYVNVKAVANRLQCCVRFIWPGIELQISQTRGNRSAIEVVIIFNVL